MEIHQLRDEIIRKMTIIPRFIKPTSTIDHAVWNNMMFINDILLQLVSNKIMKENITLSIIETFEIELEMITDVSDKIEEIEIYYIKLLDYMLKRTIEEERYEAASNIRNYITIYQNRYQI